MKASIMFDARTKLKKSTNQVNRAPLRDIYESKNNNEAARLVGFTRHHDPARTDHDSELSGEETRLYETRYGCSNY